MARLVHEARDPRERRIRSGLCHPHAHCIPKIDRPGINRIADPCRLRCAFPGQHGIVERRLAFLDHAIGCERFAGRDDHQHASLETLRSDGAMRPAFIEDHRAATHPRQQCSDSCARPVAHRRVERAPGKQEEQQHDRAVEIGMARARDGLVEAQPGRQQDPDGNRHIHVGAPVAQCHCSAREEGPAGIGHHRQGNHRRQPVEQVARSPFRTRPHADRKQHDVHHAEAGYRERPHKRR